MKPFKPSVSCASNAAEVTSYATKRWWRRIGWLIALVVVLGYGRQGAAGQFNATLNIGDATPAWTDLPGVDGGQHSLAELHDTDVLVIVFTCNSCPYAIDHEDRLIALSKKYAGRSVKLVAINVNKVEADALEAMKTRATEKGFNFAYLYDESQQIARQFGATYTPEFFVADRQRRIVYMGAMDDTPSGEGVRRRYVEDAIDAALAGRSPAVPETVAIGCGIRYARTRRK